MPETPNLNERMYPGVHVSRVLKDHLARYEFAKKFVSGKVVADIGCGEGYGAVMLKEAGASEVIALDNDPEIIEEAHKKYPTVRFVAGDATATGLTDASVDVAVSFEVWHHLDQYEKFIPEMRRILKPSGLLICSVPNKNAIYLNPFHKKMLTEFYRNDFDKSLVTQSLGRDFVVDSWYGQRFVHSFFVNPVVRFGLFVLSHFSAKIASRIDMKYKLANGPQVLTMRGENARTLIFVAHTTK